MCPHFNSQNGHSDYFLVTRKALASLKELVWVALSESEGRGHGERERVNPLCSSFRLAWETVLGSRTPKGHKQLPCLLIIRKCSTSSPEGWRRASPVAGSPGCTVTPFPQFSCITVYSFSVCRSMGQGKFWKHSPACLNWGNHSCSLLLIELGKLVNNHGPKFLY